MKGYKQSQVWLIYCETHSFPIIINNTRYFYTRWKGYSYQNILMLTYQNILMLILKYIDANTLKYIDASVSKCFLFVLSMIFNFTSDIIFQSDVWNKQKKIIQICCKWYIYRGGGTIRHFVTLNFVQAVFGPYNWDRRLNICMQPLIVVIYVDPEKIWDWWSLVTFILNSMNWENKEKTNFLFKL